VTRVVINIPLPSDVDVASLASQMEAGTLDPSSVVEEYNDEAEMTLLAD
jgi:hypothetical protein